MIRRLIPIDEAIHFNGAVRWDDIERLGREGLGIDAGILVWPVTAACYFGFVWLSDAPNRTLPRGGQWLGDMPVHPLWLIALFAQAGVSMWIMQTFVLSKPMFDSAGGFDRLRLWASD